MVPCEIVNRLGSNRPTVRWAGLIVTVVPGSGTAEVLVVVVVVDAVFGDEVQLPKARLTSAASPSPQATATRGVIISNWTPFLEGRRGRGGGPDGLPPAAAGTER